MFFTAVDQCIPKCTSRNVFNHPWIDKELLSLIKAAVSPAAHPVLRITLYIRNISETFHFVSYEVMEASTSAVSMIANVHIFTLSIAEKTKQLLYLIQVNNCSCKSSCATKMKENTNRGCPCKAKNLVWDSQNTLQE